MRQILIMLCVCLAGCLQTFAIKDNKGRESTQFVLDYNTGECSYFDCGTLDELYEWANSGLSADCEYENDDTGATVEWSVSNALFYNFVHNGCASYIPADGYYWEVRTGKYPSAFETMLPSGEIRVSFDAYMLPGSQDVFHLHEGYGINDVVVTVLSEENKEIGSYPLIMWMADQFDGTRAENSQETAYESVGKYKVLYNDYSLERGNFAVLIYMGHYEPESWTLKALTKVKYHVSHASYIPPKNTTSVIPEVSDSDSAPEYYDINGIPVDTPLNGNFYIMKCGDDVKKIFVK